MKTESNLYAGWEIISHEWKMRGKMFTELLAVFAIAQLIIALLLTRLIAGNFHFDLAVKYFLGKIALAFYINPQLTIVDFGTYSAAQITGTVAIQKLVYGKILFKFLFAIAISFCTWAALPIVIKFLKKRADSEMQSKHIRGMQLITADELAAQTKKSESFLSFGKIRFPRQYESEHIFIAGKSRVGKSVQIKQLLMQIRAKIFRACIYDFKGEYVELFFDAARDFILNPLDKRGVCWNIFSEIKSKADLNALVDSWIPEASGDEKFWSKAARDVLRGIIAALYAQNKRTNADLWRTLTMPIADIAELLKTTPAGAAGYSYIQDVSGKQAAGVIAVLMSYVSWLEFAQNEKQPGQPEFSTLSFLQSRGFLFITGRPEIEATLRPYVSLFIDLLGRRMLSLPDGEFSDEQKTFFVLDEFGNMQKLPTFKRVLTAAGSKGGTVIIGIQDFAALVKIYGREDAETMYNSCGTNLILNVTDPATARIFSDRFGHYEYEYSQKNYRMSSSDGSDGTTVSKQEKEKSLILPSEIQSLPKLTGYLKIPELNPAKISISVEPLAALKKQSESFIQAAGFDLDDIVDRQATTQAAATAAVITAGGGQKKTETEKKQSAEKMRGDDEQNISVLVDDDLGLI
ncbi:type IV secretion system DNA-binding domain-containing protein [Trichlorobacter lovleyi]|uniref:type IV secretion system DNA-binding domain-containing protein n=1 Tax=Trichlorobacter lovleyi TaxID=313985 RepID=UPI002FDD6149